MADEKPPPRVTNRAFAKESEALRTACETAGIPATKRQASKFRRKVGRAYKALTGETRA